MDEKVLARSGTAPAGLSVYGAMGLLALCVVALSLFQGLNWDEPWIYSQGWNWVHHGEIAAFKPLAGWIGIPMALGLGWLGMRLLFVLLQAGLGWAIWRLMPSGWPSKDKWLALGFLWLEPTFRERVLEIRTDTPMIILVLLGIHFAHRLGRGFQGKLVPGLVFGLALGLTPKAIIWIIPWAVVASWPGEQWLARARASLGILALAGGVLFIAYFLGAWWSHQSLMSFLGQALQDSGRASKGAGGWISPTMAFYLKQTVVLGLPFWICAIWGGFRLMKGRPGGHEAWWQVGWTGLGAFILSLLYDGAFPYHWMSIIPFLLPFAWEGATDLIRRSGKLREVVWGLGILFAVAASLPVLSGPLRPDQEARWKALKAYVGEDRGYIDGVGGLGRPQEAPFATAKTASLGLPQGTLTQWKEHRLSAILLDGRSEMLLMAPPVQSWIQAHFIKVDPMIAVLGGAGSGREEIDQIWDCPWPGTFRFRATQGWSWSLDGRSVKDGEMIRRDHPGPVHVLGKGPGNGQWIISLWPEQEPVPTEESLEPFFLPFQRLGYGWPGV